MDDGHLYGIAVRLTHGFTYKANSLGFALADLDTSEGHGRATDFLEQVADGLGRILDVGLLEQDVLLVEGVETSFNDLRNDLLRLAFSQGLLSSHATLGLDHIGRNILTGQPLGTHCGNLQSGFVSHGGTSLISGDHGHDARRHFSGLLVGVDLDVRTFDLGELADLDMLTEQSGRLFDGFFHGGFAGSGCQHFVHGSGFGLDGILENAVSEFHELRGLGHEVGLEFSSTA